MAIDLTGVPSSPRRTMGQPRGTIGHICSPCTRLHYRISFQFYDVSKNSQYINSNTPRDGQRSPAFPVQTENVRL
jgi:hypothetical protein